MSRLRYLLDENVASLFRIELVRREPAVVVWKIGDPGLPPRGTLDPEILRWCEEQDFLLVTNNRKSMPEHLAAHLDAGRHVPGIKYFYKFYAKVLTFIEKYTIFFL